MIDIIYSDLDELRASVVRYAHDNPHQRSAIRSLLETIIQSELDSSTHRHQQAPNETPSIPRFNASPDVLDVCEPHCNIDRPGEDQSKPISRRRGPRRRLSPIKVPQRIVPPPPPAREQIQRSSQNVKAIPIHRTSPTTSERVSPTCTTNQALVAKASEAPVAHRQKRRRLNSDVVAASPREAEVDNTPSSKSRRNSTCGHPSMSGGGRIAHALEVSALPRDLVSKVSRIGSVEVLKDLRETLFRLRTHPGRSSPSSNDMMTALDTSRSLLAARALSILRVELEVTEMGEQLHRFRKRIAVSRFFDLYELLQANPSLILPLDPETMGETSPDVTSKQAPRLSSQVLTRVADLMFLNTAHVNESIATASGAAGRVHEERHRKAAMKKIQDWRRNGKPWSAMIRRFGTGVLLLLPKNLSDENLRTTKAATFEELLNVMESMLSHSKVLLRSATALSGSLIQCQAPPETLRLETDSTLLDTDEECSLHDLNALLEPCGLVAPRQNCRNDTVQAEESSSSLAVGPSLSPLPFRHLFTSRQSSPRDLKSSGSLTNNISGLTSAAKRGVSAVYSNLSSPARLPTPGFFHSALSDTNLCTPSIASPFW